MVCLELMMITTPDYSYAALCHALAGFVIRIMFQTYYVPPEIWLASLIGRLQLFIVYAD